MPATCETCARPSLAGGRWCLDCFRTRATGVVPETGCGTDAGFRRHHRAGEQPCRRCKDAHAAYNRWHPNRHLWGTRPRHRHDWRLDRDTWRWVCACGKRQTVGSA